MLSRLPSSFVVGDLRLGLMPLDLEKDYHIYEQWLLNGERIEGKKKDHPPSIREKTSLCVNSGTPETFKSAYMVFLTLPYLSNLLNPLGYSSLLEHELL